MPSTITMPRWLSTETSKKFQSFSLEHKVRLTESNIIAMKLHSVMLRLYVLYKQMLVLVSLKQINYLLMLMYLYLEDRYKVKSKYQWS